MPLSVRSLFLHAAPPFYFSRIPTALQILSCRMEACEQVTPEELREAAADLTALLQGSLFSHSQN